LTLENADEYREVAPLSAVRASTRVGMSITTGGPTPIGAHTLRLE
jgi:hypothetical protein